MVSSLVRRLRTPIAKYDVTGGLRSRSFVDPDKMDLMRRTGAVQPTDTAPGNALLETQAVRGQELDFGKSPRAGGTKTEPPTATAKLSNRDIGFSSTTPMVGRQAGNPTMAIRESVKDDNYNIMVGVDPRTTRDRSLYRPLTGEQVSPEDFGHMKTRVYGAGPAYGTDTVEDILNAVYSSGANDDIPNALLSENIQYGRKGSKFRPLDSDLKVNTLPYRSTSQAFNQTENLSASADIPFDRAAQRLGTEYQVNPYHAGYTVPNAENPVPANVLSSRLRRSGMGAQQAQNITGRVGRNIPQFDPVINNDELAIRRRTDALRQQDEIARGRIAEEQATLDMRGQPRTNFIVQTDPTKEYSLYSQVTENAEGTNVPSLLAGSSLTYKTELPNLVTTTYGSGAPTPIELRPGAVGLNQKIGRGSPQSRAYIQTKNFVREETPEEIPGFGFTTDEGFQLLEEPVFQTRVRPNAIVQENKYIPLDPVPDVDRLDSAMTYYGEGKGIDISLTPEQMRDRFRRDSIRNRALANLELTSPTARLSPEAQQKANTYLEYAARQDSEARNIQAAIDAANAQSVMDDSHTLIKRTAGPRGGNVQYTTLEDQPLSNVAKAAAGSRLVGDGIVEEVLYLPRVAREDAYGNPRGVQQVKARLRKAPEGSYDLVTNSGKRILAGPQVDAQLVGTKYDTTILDDPNNIIFKEIKALDPTAEVGQIRQGVRYVELPGDAMGRAIGTDVRVINPGKPVPGMTYDNQPIIHVDVEPTGEVMKPYLGGRLRESPASMIERENWQKIQAADEGALVMPKRMMGRLDVENLAFRPEDIEEIRRGVPQEVLQANRGALYDSPMDQATARAMAADLAALKYGLKTGRTM